MTRQEYISAAKRLNQRMVEAERVASMSSEYTAIASALAREGRKRLPERVGNLSDADLAPYEAIVTQYSGVRSFRAKGVKARTRLPRMTDKERADKNAERDLRRQYSALRRRVNRQLQNLQAIPGALKGDTVTQMFADIESTLKPGGKIDSTTKLPTATEIKPESLDEAIQALTIYSNTPYMRVKSFTPSQFNQLNELSTVDRQRYFSGRRIKDAPKGDIWALSKPERQKRYLGYMQTVFARTLPVWARDKSIDMTPDEWADVAYLMAHWREVQARGFTVVPSDEAIDSAIDIVLNNRQGKTPDEYQTSKDAFAQAVEIWSQLPASELLHYSSFTNFLQMYIRENMPKKMAEKS